MIILFGSQKGGCGKSTLAINTACYLANTGGDVVLVDADIQQSSANWVRDREQTGLKAVHCVQRYGDIKSTLKDLAGRYQHVVVDVAGHDSKELRTAMLVADKLIVPFRPSQLDLDTLPHLSEVIDQATSFNESLKAYGLLTLAPTNPANQEIKQAGDYLSDFPLLTPLHAVIHDRKIYRDAISEGKGVIEGNNQKASDEFTALMTEILA
ncbi:AAA family ATPase [Moraxella bovis]|uniref:AAA family ATPase n=1 Tax=Moraxella bovis TaxID=476 RepID=Q5KTB0_MORBO|nr:AAA family ATPase [Moraxella bovis]AWY21785.1 cobyrinic acid ac-diamide synthase [Moraxella bovis]UYZ77082.1 AAA family ATPase [Moraxella bovis]UYZ79754.1 AAA family ATPase [Moraxella bovis]UYZ82540.1 AAA family ATPase [Moraxella bovis]UYZ88241.1 AAA family ATPase [Moraxella bovis]